MFDRGNGVAEKVATLFSSELPIRIRAYDGSTSGNPHADEALEIKSPLALRYMLSHPGDLGLARAYITSNLEVEGDFYQTLVHLKDHIKKPFEFSSLAKLATAVGSTAFIRPQIPREEAPPRWRRGALHSLNRDRSAIHHHYDVSNDFYRNFLGPTMVYSCALFADESVSLDAAQIAKVDLICQKLDLKAGMRLLDIGCGWGTLILHAAKEYGVTALGVTLSTEQQRLARQRIETAGLSDRIEVRLQDYRDVRDENFDAISSVGMSEHVGDKQLDAYFAHLRRRISDDGRLLNHCITRYRGGLPAKSGAFIDRYIFPDGELSGPDRVVESLTNNGFELRHSENLREHYALTLSKWCENLVHHWDEAVDEVGLIRARLWNLYMTMSRIGFESNGIQIHQFLGDPAVASGKSNYPLRPNWSN